MPIGTGLKLFTVSLMLSATAFAAQAETFNIPGGDLKAALDQYARQTGAALVYSDEALGKTHTKGVRGDLSSTDALSRILSGTGRFNAGLAAVMTIQGIGASLSNIVAGWLTREGGYGLAYWVHGLAALAAIAVFLYGRREIVPERRASGYAPR